MKSIWLMVGCGMLLAAQNPEDALRAEKKAAALADEVKSVVLRLNGQTAEFVSGQLISGSPVKGAPYSAEAVNETIQTLADGNRIVQRNSAMQYRDNDGRERREETSAMGAIFITDPVAGTRYTLHPEAKTAEKGLGPLRVTVNGGNMFFYDSGGPGPGQPGGRSGGPEQGFVIQHTEAGVGRGLTITTARTGGPGASANDSAKTEQLGNLYIEGVQAQGTRTTTTIPAGTIGNDRPINIVDERWYSPDLQMTVMTKHSDPRMGETTFQLKNINRSVPPPYLFEVPSDYTVTTGGGRGGRSGGPAPGTFRLAEPKK